eukprot:UN11482
MVLTWILPDRRPPLYGRAATDYYFSEKLHKMISHALRM